MYKVRNMTIDHQLWLAYRDPFFKFVQPIAFECFAIITAWNPRSVWLSKSDNERKNQYLAQDISHTCWCKVLVGNADFSWMEESFAAQVSQKAAIQLGQKYQQNAVYYVEGETLYLLSCLEDNHEVALGSWRSRCR